jgi:hypothetical protein
LTAHFKGLEDPGAAGARVVWSSTRAVGTDGSPGRSAG